MLRLFVAIRPPVELAATMLQALDSVELPPHRPTKAEQMHLTAMFIGDRRERERPEVEESVRAACAGIAPFELRSVRLAALPERGLKRTIVLECDRPAGLLELHARLAQRFARDLRPNARDRFLPHITIGRFRGMGVDCSLDLPLSGPAFTVDRAHLVASVLRPEGAVHRDLLTVQLSAN